MKKQADEIRRKNQKISWILATIFLLALIMGPGPGLYIVNDFAAKGGSLFGIPILYVWAIFWFGVEAVVILFAYFVIWNDERL